MFNSNKIGGEMKLLITLIMAVMVMVGSDTVYAKQITDTGLYKKKVETSKVAHVKYIYDEIEAEIILTLENEVSLRCKAAKAPFYPGQAVELQFNEDKSRILVARGGGRMEFSRTSDNKRFYVAL